MIRPDTCGTISTTLARATASSVRGCRSVMLQTQSTSTTVPNMMTRLIIWPAIFRHGSFLGGRCADGGAGFGGTDPEGGGGVGAFIGMSIYEKDQPNSEGEENQHAGVNQRFGAYIRLYPKTDE